MSTETPQRPLPSRRARRGKGRRVWPVLLVVALVMALGVVAVVTQGVGTSEEADVADWTPPETRYDYQTSSGDTVIVDPYEPLPEEVVEDLSAPVAEAVEEIPESDVIELEEGEQHPAAAAYDAASDVAIRAADETGKRVIVIYRSYGSYDEEPDKFQWLWTSTMGGFISPDRDEAVALAEEYVAGQDVPDAWEVIVVD